MKADLGWSNGNKWIQGYQQGTQGSNLAGLGSRQKVNATCNRMARDHTCRRVSQFSTHLKPSNSEIGRRQAGLGDLVAMCKQRHGQFRRSRDNGTSAMLRDSW